MERFFFLAGSVSGFAAVALGAFAAHGLKQRLSPDLFAVFEVGARYHMYHALALLGAAYACGKWPPPWPALAGWFFLLGTIVFSGSLYLLALTGARWLGAVTPLGGLGFLAGWACLAYSIWRTRG